MVTVCILFCRTMQGAVRWVLWDIKDTLLKVRHSVGEQYCNEAKRAGLQLPAMQVETAFRQAYRQQSRLYPNYGIAQGMNGQVWWTGLVKSTFSQCGVQDPALLDTLANNLYQNFCNSENWEVRGHQQTTCTLLFNMSEVEGCRATEVKYLNLLSAFVLLNATNSLLFFT